MATNSTSSSSPPIPIPPLEMIEQMTRNAHAVQEKVLAQILTQNAHTEYLKTFNLGTYTDRKTFKSKVPLVTYEDIKPLIHRTANGDRSPVLCAQPITGFITSSGTAGEPKLIPSTKDLLDRGLLLCSFIYPIVKQQMKGFEKGKTLSFMFIRPETETRGGIPIQVALTRLYKSTGFENLTRDMFTSPKEAVICTELFQSTYTQMLCGLYERNQIHSIHTLFASGLVRLIKFLHLHWQQLTHDIRTGSLDPRVTNEPIREYMARTYLADPDLADSIAQECARDNWEGIIVRIWPNAKVLETVATGTMAQYILTLDYYSRGLPIVSMIYAASESYLGINLDPTSKPPDVSYTFMPFLAYFEFLPCEPDSRDSPDQLELIDLVDVQIGKQYEVVITTPAGLYRYRLGDIVQVTGFHNSAPQFQFVRRKDVVLNIDGEKTMETELQVAVENASRLLVPFDAGVLDYTSRADTTTIPGHYVVYWELLVKDSSGFPSDEVLDKCCLAMEESFNSLYQMFRGISIGPLELRVVREGTFEKMTENAISKGVLVSQYKVPRSVKSSETIGLLDSRVRSKHFSMSVVNT